MERASFIDDPTPRCTIFLAGRRCTGCKKKHLFNWQEGILCQGNNTRRCDFGSRCWYLHNPPLPRNELPPEPKLDEYLIEPLAVNMFRLHNGIPSKK